MIYSLGILTAWGILLVSNVSPRLTGWTTLLAIIAVLDLAARVTGI